MSPHGFVPSSWFAIRRKRDGAFLPSVASYGFTRQEPSLSDPPRLFKHQHNATQALQWWCKGEAFEERKETDGFGGEVEIAIRVIPKSGRHISDFEIVVVRLAYRTLEQEALDRL